MCEVLVICDEAEASLGDRLVRDLTARHFNASLGEFGTGMASVPRWRKSGSPLIVVVVPPARRQRVPGIGEHVAALRAAAAEFIVVTTTRGPLPPHFEGDHVRALLRGDRMDYDILFERLLLAIHQPPDWLTLCARPSLFEKPTGVAWWREELVVADEAAGRIVQIGTNGTTVLAEGLRQPHHVYRDRDKLLVTDKAESNLLLIEVADAMARRSRVVTSARRRRFNNVAGVHQSHGITVVADTDNHRVVVTRDDLFWNGNGHVRPASWDELSVHPPFRFPCGTHVDHDVVWVADTFNDRIVAFDHLGRWVRDFGDRGSGLGELQRPVAVETWADFVIVADEGNHRVQMFSRRAVDAGERGHRAVVSGGLLAADFVHKPFGLSVNQHADLAISDRTRGCVWIVSLPRWVRDAAVRV